MREVTINGETVKLETGKTPPPHTLGREKGPFRLLLEAMNDGESFFLNTSIKAIPSGTMSNVGKATGSRFMSRSEDGGVRIYRMAGGVTGRGAAAPATRAKKSANGASDAKPAFGLVANA